MSGFIIEYTTHSNAFVQIDGHHVEFWEGVGPRTFKGVLDSFATAYPAVVEEMVQRGIIRPV